MTVIAKDDHLTTGAWAACGHTKQKSIESYAITTQDGLRYTLHSLLKGIPIPTRENNPYFIS